MIRKDLAGSSYVPKTIVHNNHHILLQTLFPLYG